MTDKHTLVERLGWHHEHPVAGKMVLINPYGPEAATRITALEAEKAELVEVVARLTTFVEALADNDLDEPIADNGMTVGGKLQFDAPALVLYARATLTKAHQSEGAPQP